MTAPAASPAAEPCAICGRPAAGAADCTMGHTAADRASFEAYLAEMASQCPMCQDGRLATPGDEATCENRHTAAELAEYALWCSGGEDHLDDCQEFTDMGGEHACTCGGMGCDAGWTTGPSHDPYGVSCDYIRRDHPRTPDGKHLLHRGGDPFLEDELLEWTGGGTIVGDAVPHTVVRHLAACPLAPEPVPDEDLYEHIVRDHQRPAVLGAGPGVRGNPDALRVLHRMLRDEEQRAATEAEDEAERRSPAAWAEFRAANPEA
jgi:hypothetical protein